ncbi:response regulator [Shewanella eurypsychrophilus]|uniref:Response regulator n=1 Tax=Shewanella eurypsychrophilus TaxID=2593656 RepID=A0ABX6V420_9GAMM|nr:MULTISPECIES: response regulator [Shewanella]QFU21322.1 response regulator [Shewanella sp. YLB-09]QPG56612.1 response regulator [Shewanella eurypsychrophilus]
MGIIKSVLVVDDSRMSRIMITSIVQGSFPEWTVHQAANGQEAIDVARVNQIDFVTLDLNMPVMNGLEAAPELLVINPDIKIALLTANIQSSTQEQVKSLGIDFIPKPISGDKILAFLG